MAKYRRNTKVSVRVYLDNAATTPLSERAKKAMGPYLSKQFGNPSSIHREGVEAKRALLEARKKIAAVLHALPDEIIFTSGATEANNLSIFGVLDSLRTTNYVLRTKKPHVVTSAIEHHSVLEPIKELEKRGEIIATYLPVTSEGVVDLEALKKALRLETVLVSVMYANNEIGTVQPITEIARIIRQFKKSLSPNPTELGDRESSIVNSVYPILHIDAAQAPGNLDLNVLKLHADLMSFTAQKFYGPKGVGFLYKRRSVSIAPQMFGGGQERGMRSGTENVAGIVAMAEALAEAEEMREKESERLSKLREYFINQLLKIPGTVLNGPPAWQHSMLPVVLPGVVNVSFAGVEGEWVVIGLDAKGVAVSTGSACTTGGTEASHVILALGRPKQEAIGAVRFSFGRSTTRHDLDYVLKIIPRVLDKGKL